jgi:hypothetical protein
VCQWQTLYFIGAIRLWSVLNANPNGLFVAKYVWKGWGKLVRFIYTRDLDLAISLSDAISIEILPSFQIATAGDSDNVYCFLACVNTTLELKNE